MKKKSYIFYILNSIVSFGNLEKNLILQSVSVFFQFVFFLTNRVSNFVRSMGKITIKLIHFVANLLIRTLESRSFRFASYGIIFGFFLFILLIKASYIFYKKPSPAMLSIFDSHNILLYQSGSQTLRRAPHAVDYVLNFVKHSDLRILEAGGTVQTTIDLSLQNLIQQALLEKVYDANPDREISVLVVDPKSMRIVSFMGSFNYYSKKGYSLDPLLKKGLLQELTLISKIQDYEGKTLYEKKHSNSSSPRVEKYLKGLGFTVSSYSDYLIAVYAKHEDALSSEILRSVITLLQKEKEV